MNTLSFPILRVVVVTMAFFAAIFWARNIVKVAPTTDMIKYISSLLAQNRVWREDDEQLRIISESNSRAGDTWYLYHQETHLQIYFSYIKSEGTENYSVYCVTEWGSGLIKAEFAENTFVSGSFNDQNLISGHNPALQAELGSIIRLIRLIANSHSPASSKYQMGATSLI